PQGRSRAQSSLAFAPPNREIADAVRVESPGAVERGGLEIRLRSSRLPSTATQKVRYRKASGSHRPLSPQPISLDPAAFGSKVGSKTAGRNRCRECEKIAEPELMGGFHGLVYLSWANHSADGSDNRRLSAWSRDADLFERANGAATLSDRYCRMAQH